ncbi:HutD family protein [Caenimonas sedimenti]|uniref:HutD family protein n=1 Tax=Caenimonas sedimenti TaxID=2596921 RepID=A0A562ZWD1_9BURK|nr:HutD family protein [Caenimonas sedimenti]TWO72783.1 HutD family protein [Caenimonas sedimenti]
MRWNVVTLAEVAASPWRNGGGVTRELLAWPAVADWELRVSVADIASDGPFSAYPGIERWFAVLEGGAVRLRVGQDEHTLDADSAPLRFDGAAPVDCRVAADGTRDFNLMAPPGRALLRRTAGPQRFEPQVPAIVGVYVHANAAQVACGPAAADLRPGSFAWLQTEGPASVQLQATQALWIEFRL